MESFLGHSPQTPGRVKRGEEKKEKGRGLKKAVGG
jgi:hypothetical protein